MIAPSADSLAAGAAARSAASRAGDARARRLQRHGRRAASVPRGRRRRRPAVCGERRAADRHGGQPRRRKNPGAARRGHARDPRTRCPASASLLVGAFPRRRPTRRRVRAAHRRARARATPSPSRASSPNPFPVVRALDVLVHPALRDPVPARAARGHGARAADRRVGGRRHPRDAGRRRERLLVPPDDRGRAGQRRSSACCAIDARGAPRSARRRYAAPDDALHARRLRRARCSPPSTRPSRTGRRDGATSPSSLPTYERARTRCAASVDEPARRRRGVDLEVRGGGRRLDRRHAGACSRRIGDARLRVVLRSPHAGIAAARNAGIAAARAPFVAFHDSDDLALAGSARACRSRTSRAHPDVDLVIQNGRMLPPEDDPAAGEEPWIRAEVARTLAARPIGVAEVFRWNLGQLQGMCFTRRALEAVGPLDGRFRILDDLDLVLRVTAQLPGGVPRRAGVRVPPPRRRHRARPDARARGVDPPGGQARRPSIPRCSTCSAGDVPRRQARRWARLASDAGPRRRRRAARAPRSGARRRLDPAQPALSPARALAAAARRRADADRVHAPPASPAAARRPTSAAWRRGLVARGHEVHVFCARAGEAPPGVAVHRVPDRARRARSRACCRSRSRAPRAVARERWDVVVGFGRTLRQDVVRVGGGTHRTLPRAHGSRRAARRACAGPYHRAILWLERRQFAPRRAPPRPRRLARGGERGARRTTASRASSIAVVYNGVDLERFHPAQRRDARAGRCARALGIARRRAAVRRRRHRLRAQGLRPPARALARRAPPRETRSSSSSATTSGSAAWRREAAAPAAGRAGHRDRPARATSRRCSPPPTWSACRRARRRSATSCSRRARPASRSSRAGAAGAAELLDGAARRRSSSTIRRIAPRSRRRSTRALGAGRATRSAPAARRLAEALPWERAPRRIEAAARRRCARWPLTAAPIRRGTHRRLRALAGPAVDPARGTSRPTAIPIACSRGPTAAIVKLQRKVIVGRASTRRPAPLYVKRYNVYAWRDRARQPRAAVAGASRACDAARALAALGFATPRPVAAVEFRRARAAAPELLRHPRGGGRASRPTGAGRHARATGRGRAARRGGARARARRALPPPARGRRVPQRPEGREHPGASGRPSAPRWCCSTSSASTRRRRVSRRRRVKNLVQLERTLGRARARATDRAALPARLPRRGRDARPSGARGSRAISAAAARKDRRGRAARRRRRAPTVVVHRRLPGRGGAHRRVPRERRLVRRGGGGRRRLARRARSRSRGALHRPRHPATRGRATARRSSSRSTPRRGEWVLNLDADERVTPELATEIRRALAACRADVDGFAIPRLVPYLGRWWYRGGWYPRPVVRLVRRDRDARGAASTRTIAPRSRGRVLPARRPILHYTYADVADHLRSVAQADGGGGGARCRPAGASGSARLAGEPAWRFVRAAILQARRCSRAIPASSSPRPTRSTSSCAGRGCGTASAARARRRRRRTCGASVVIVNWNAGAALARVCRERRGRRARGGAR